MPVVIEVSGPSAVGKSTAIRALAPVMGAVIIPEVLQTTTHRLPRPTSAAEFLANQTWLVEQTSIAYARARLGAAPARAEAYLVDSGLVDVLSFARHFPQAANLDWDVLDNLARVALGLERRLGLRLGPDVLLYLSATQPTIRARREADGSTSRRDHEENARLLPYESAYFRRLAELYPAAVQVIDAETGPEEVVRQATAAVDRWRTEAKPGPGLAGLLRSLGWNGTEPSPLPVSGRLAGNLEGAGRDVGQVLDRLGSARLDEILRQVNLSDRELLAVLESEVTAGRVRTEGLGYWVETQVSSAELRRFSAVAATLFNPHRAAAAADAQFAPLRQRYEELLADRPAPRTDYDQRHVTARTSLLRALYLLHRGDLAGKRVVLLGDDDLTGLALALVGGWSSLTILEIDERLVRFLAERFERLGLEDARVLAYDAEHPLPRGLRGSADTVLCDPSRPLYDLFVRRSIQILRPRGAFYTFILPSHSPPDDERVFFRRTLTRGLELTDLVPVFNEYRRYPETLSPDYDGRYPATASPDDMICFTESLARFVRG